MKMKRRRQGTLEGYFEAKKGKTAWVFELVIFKTLLHLYYIIQSSTTERSNRERQSAK